VVVTLSVMFFMLPVPFAAMALAVMQALVLQVTPTAMEIRRTVAR